MSSQCNGCKMGAICSGLSYGSGYSKDQLHVRWDDNIMCGLCYRYTYCWVQMVVTCICLFLPVGLVFLCEELYFIWLLLQKSVGGNLVWNGSPSMLASLGAQNTFTTENFWKRM